MQVKSAEEACEAAAKSLTANPYDVPFALMYLLDDKAEEATLCAVTGFELGCVNAPEHIDMTEPADAVKWPLRRVFESGAGEVVSNIKALPGGAWPESSKSAFVLPISAPGYAKPDRVSAGPLRSRGSVERFRLKRARNDQGLETSLCRFRHRVTGNGWIRFSAASS